MVLIRLSYSGIVLLALCFTGCWSYGREFDGWCIGSADNRYRLTMACRCDTLLH